MGPFSKLTDQEIDRLIAGKPSGNGDLEELAAFVGDVREAYEKAPSDATAAAHLAAIAEAAQLVGQDDRDRSATAHFGRKTTLRNPFAKIRTKLAVVGAAALMLGAFGGVAHAGALPDPVQGTVSDFAGSLGIDVPGTDGGHVADVNDAAQEAADAAADAADQAADDAADAADQAADDAADAADEANDNPGTGGGGGGSTDDGAAGNSDDGAQNDVNHDAQDDANDAAEEAADQAKDAAEEAADKAADGAEGDNGDSGSDGSDD